MGFSYFDGQFWLDISREERLFCAHLYHDIRSGRLEQQFVSWLAHSDNIWRDGAAPETLVVEQEWEIAYEVCFYRDLLNSRKQSVNLTDYPNKRTFDLCLFSEKCIVIVEAKVHERFDGKQVQSVMDDKDSIKKVVAASNGSAPEVLAIALASSTYFANVPTYGHQIEGPLHNAFDAKVTWKAVGELLNNSLYVRADREYPYGGVI